MDKKKQTGLSPFSKVDVVFILFQTITGKKEKSTAIVIRDDGFKVNDPEKGKEREREREREESRIVEERVFFFF